MNIKDLKEALPYLFKANVATMLVGHHGVGKSQAAAQYANENGFDFIDLRLGTQDVGDLLGLADFERDKDGNLVATKFMRPDWFPVDPKSKGIIFLDEVNRARRDVLQAVFQLVLDKRIHRYELPKPVWNKKDPLKVESGWFVLAAMNPNTDDYIVTDISDKAFMDRFCHIKLSPSRPEFFDYARTKGFDPQLMEFLESNPKMLQAKLEDFNLDVSPSRRSWETIDRLIQQKVPVHLFRNLAMGLVGPQATSALIKALNQKDKPITAEDVVKHYPKFQKRMQKYSNIKTNQQAAVKFTCNDLVQYAEKRKDPLSKDEKKNLQQFLLDIPNELSYDTCRTIYFQDPFREVIEESNEILKIFAQRKNMKVKGINS